MITYYIYALLKVSFYMNFNVRKYFSRGTLYFALLYLFTYALYHITYYVVSSAALVYINGFVNKATYLLVPILGSVLTLVASSHTGTKSALIRSISFYLVRMIYFVPYFYMLNYSYSFGYDSLEALFIAIPLSLIEAAIVYLVSTLIFLLMKYIICKRVGEEKLATELEGKVTLNFSSSVCIAFTVISALSFLYFLVLEIIDTVSFLTEVRGTAKVGELIYIMISYVFDVALFFLHFFAMAFVKNKLTESISDAE